MRVGAELFFFLGNGREVFKSYNGRILNNLNALFPKLPLAYAGIHEIASCCNG